MNHCRDAFGAILVFDLTREKTFISCLNWLEDFRATVGEEPMVLMIGNKLDIVELDENNRKVNKQMAEQMAKRNGMLYIETSAVTNKNVEEAFEKLLMGEVLVLIL